MSVLLNTKQLYQLYLWTPWDKRMLDGLPSEIQEKLKCLEKEFVIDCYLRPFRKSSQKTLTAELKRRIEEDDESPIVIIGFSGIGKSTFINATLYTFGDFYKKVILDAVDKIVLPSNYLWSAWLNRNCTQLPLTREVITLLLVKIYELLDICDKPICEVGPAMLDLISFHDIVISTLKNYEIYFDRPNCLLHGIFDDARDYLTEISEKNNVLYDEYEARYIKPIVDGLYRICLDYSSTQLIGISDELITPMNIIQALIKIYSILLICKESNPRESCKHLIVFDNIEHFVKDDVVYDFEIEALLKTIRGFIPEQNAIYGDFHRLFSDKNNPYSYYFRIILSIREVSDIMQRDNAFIDVPDYYLTNITLRDHFSFQKIVENKHNFFKNYNITFDIKSISYNGSFFSIIDIIMRILNDQAMNDQLSEMYSYNKRRILYGLLESFHSVNSNEIQKLRNKQIAQYLILYDKTEHINPDVNQNLYSAYKHGLRRMVMRMQFDSIANTFRVESKEHYNRNNYFNEIDAISSRDGLARRIMVFLSRHPVVDLENADGCAYKQAMVKFSDLLKAVFIKPNDLEVPNCLKIYASRNPKDINKLADIIFCMRDRKLERRWVPLILLKYNEPGIIDAERIRATLFKICDDPNYEYENSNNSLKYGLKATIAGRRFTALTEDFEYFAVRYSSSEIPISKCYPLFDYRNFYSDTGSDYMELGINLVKFIRDKAMACIEIMKTHNQNFVADPHDSKLFHYNSLYSLDLTEGEDNVQYLYRKYDFDMRKNMGGERTHSERIILSHIRYIDNYRLYLINELINKDMLDDADLNFLTIVYSFENESKNYDAEKFYQTFITKHQATLERLKCYINIRKAMEFSLSLLKIIESYLEKYDELTHLSSGTSEKPALREYFIGGYVRGEGEAIGIKYEDQEYGVNTLFQNLKAIVGMPLNVNITILPESDN